MALKPCRECSREVSTEAATCPGCGVAHPAGRGAPQVVEATGKDWKTAQLGGLFLILFGGFWVFIATFDGGETRAFGILAQVSLVGGCLLWLGAKFGAWWHHG